jgi:hypothetical protein
LEQLELGLQPFESFVVSESFFDEFRLEQTLLLELNTTR